MFSSRCIRMVNLVISSSEHHSPYVIKAGFSLSWMASTCLRMINTSCSISFHREKFFPSNFCIFTFVPDCVTIFRKVGFLLTWSSLSFGSLPLSVFLFFVVAAQQNLTLIPLEESIWGRVYVRTCKVNRIQQTTHIFDKEKSRRELQWKFFVLLQNSIYKKIKKHSITRLGFGLYTRALTYERVHTFDTKWKEPAFYANKIK